MMIAGVAFFVGHPVARHFCRILSLHALHSARIFFFLNYWSIGWGPDSEQTSSRIAFKQKGPTLPHVRQQLDTPLPPSSDQIIWKLCYSVNIAIGWFGEYTDGDENATWSSKQCRDQMQPILIKNQRLFREC